MSQRVRACQGQSRILFNLNKFFSTFFEQCFPMEIIEYIINKCSRFVTIRISRTQYMYNTGQKH